LTIKELINKNSKDISTNEVFLALEKILGKTKEKIIISLDDELSEEVSDIVLNCFDALRDGYPVQYITGKQEFMGMTFKVNENVLIPQPDTEVVVEKAIETINIYDFENDNDKDVHIFNSVVDSDQKVIKILDLCTGSGAIAISIAKKFENNINFHVDITASDISLEALEVARENAINNNAQIKLVESNMFENLDMDYDIIVSNPPYIKTNVIDTLDKNVQCEPHLALDGGEDGLRFYRIIKRNLDRLKPNGYLILEIGYDQANDIKKIFDNVKIYKDYGGNDRVAVIKKEE
jgi:release factor glutamine methyltransferase